MKIIITGSHFTPAQATINELKKIDEKIEIVYLGRKTTLEGDNTKSVESQVLPALGVKFIPIITGRLQRSLTIHTIPSLLKIPVGIIQSFYLILKENPDVVLSFGGYVAVPVVISAWLLSKPVIIHEQTLVTGLANKISSWFADKIAVSFNTKFDFPKEKIVVTGNPMRQELLIPDKNKCSEEVKKILSQAEKNTKKVILITGGNQGSHTINQSIADILGELTQQYVVIHQTGDSRFKDYDSLLEKQKELDYPENYLAKKWLDVDEIGLIYQHADLVIGRAGMNTLLELNYFKIKNIVIPIKNHYEQGVNADYFSKNGLSTNMSEEESEKGKLLGVIESVLKLRTQTSELLTPQDAAKSLALETLLLVNKPS